MFRTSCPPFFPLTSSLNLLHHFSIPSLFSSPLHSTPDQREKERETRLQELRQQREERAQKGHAGVGAGEVVMRKVEKSADGSSLSQVTKTNRFAQSGSFFFSCLFLCIFRPLLNLYLYLITQVNNEPILIHSFFFLQSEDTKGLLGGKKEKQAGKT